MPATRFFRNRIFHTAAPESQRSYFKGRDIRLRLSLDEPEGFILKFLHEQQLLNVDPITRQLLGVIATSIRRVGVGTLGQTARHCA
jgi:hypothetical protein